MHPTDACLPAEMPRAEAVPRTGELPRTRAMQRSGERPWLFAAVCLYLLSQAYLVPLLALGPSWTMWPRLTDLVTGLFAVCLLPSLTRGALPGRHARILVWLLACLWVSVLSFVVFTLLLPRLSSLFPAYPQAVQWGCYQILRLAQFIFVFFATAQVPLTAARRRWLSRLAALVLALLCASVVATYLGLVPNELVVAHLPDDPGVAGPWADYGEDGDGLGTIGYNHAYPAVQIMLAFAFYFCLIGRRLTPLAALLLLAALVAVFLSGSRAGFGTMLLLAMITVWQWIDRGHLAAVVAAAGGSALVATALLLLPGSGLTGTARQLGHQHDEMLSRQVTTFKGYRSKNLSGRAEIWASRIEYLNDAPYRWLVGAGFGSAPTSGKNAHMQPLNVIIETGILGLLIGCGLTWMVFQALWDVEPRGRPFFWGTFAIAVTCITQETFYPVPALGHFPGFYVFCLAIVLRLPQGDEQSG